MKYCPNCQHALADGITFCSRCGTKLPASTAPVVAPEPTFRQAPKPKSNAGLAVALWVSLAVNLLICALLISLLLGVFGPLAQQKQLQEQVDSLQSQIKVLEEVYRGLDIPNADPATPTDPQPTDPENQDSPDAPTRPASTTKPTQTTDRPEDAVTEPEATDAPTEGATLPVPPDTMPTEPEGYDGYYVVNTKEYPLNIRSNRSTEGKILGTIPIGTRIYVTAATGIGPDDWGYVDYNGIRGYVAMQYLLED